MKAICFFDIVLIWLFPLCRSLEAEYQNWSNPQCLTSGSARSISFTSNLLLTENSVLHFAWLWKKDTLVYAQVQKGQFRQYYFKFQAGQLRTILFPRICIQNDSCAYLFWIEKWYGQDSTYHSKGICSEIRLSKNCSNIILRADTLKDRSSHDEVDYLCPCVSNDGTIYVCWEESNQWAIFLSSKPKGQSDWIIPGGPMFPEFMNDAGNAWEPHLISGTLQDLYLTFIGSRDADAVGGPAYKYTNFVYYAEKPFYKGRWNGPVLVYKDFVSAASEPRIAVDKSGVRHILWMQMINPKQCFFILRPFYSFSYDGQHWSPAQDLAGWSAWFGSHQIVIDSQGTVHVFWCQYRPTEQKSTGIYYCHGRETTWSEPQLIFAGLPDKWYDLAGIAIDGNDRLHMIREVAYGPQGGIYKRELEYLWCDLSPTAIVQSLRHHPNRVQGPLSVQTYPNPFNDTITMTLLPQKECRVSLEIYNIAGQCVRRIMDEVMIAGEYSCQWDGRNDTGLALPSGIYYLKANALEGERARPFQIVSKLLLLK